MEERQSSRRRVQFGLKLLLLSTAFVAVAAGWCGQHLRWITQRHEFLETDGIRYRNWDETSAPWPLTLFNEQGVELLELPSVQHGNLEWAEQLFPEAVIHLKNEPHSDDFE